MRRGLALAALVAVLAGLSAYRADGQVAPSTEIEFLVAPPGTPVDQLRSWSPASGAEIDGTWKIRVRARSSGSLESIGLRLEAEEPHLPVPSSPVVSETYPIVDQVASKDVIYSWNSRALTARNGRYRWVAQATSHPVGAAQAVLEGLKVVNRPLQPTGVAVSLEGERPVVTWNANSEPDILEYRVWRAPDQTDLFDVVGRVSTAEFRDGSAPPGPQIYRLNAVRRSPSSPRGLTSDLSEVAGPVVVPGALPAPPVPPPAAPAQPERAAPAPKRNFGRFATTLPYASVPAPAATQPAAPPPPVETRPIAQPVARISLSERLRYIGIGLLLLVTALLSWRGRQHLVSSPVATTATEPGPNPSRPTQQTPNLGDQVQGRSR